MLGWFPAGSVLPHGVKVSLLALVGYPPTDGITIKIPYGVDVLLHQPACTLLLLHFIVRSVETNLGR